MEEKQKSNKQHRHTKRTGTTSSASGSNHGAPWTDHASRRKKSSDRARPSSSSSLSGSSANKNRGRSRAAPEAKREDEHKSKLGRTKQQQEESEKVLLPSSAPLERKQGRSPRKDSNREEGRKGSHHHSKTKPSSETNELDSGKRAKMANNHKIMGETKTMVFGNGAGGRLGLGEVEGGSVWEPTLVRSLGPMKIVQVAAGGTFSMVLTEMGSVYWFGQLGGWKKGVLQSSKPLLRSLSPRPLAGSDRFRTIQIAAGHSFGIVLTEKGELYGWGQGRNGELGTGKKEDLCELPKRIETLAAMLPSNKVVKLRAAFSHSLALLENGQVYSWGRQDDYKLGWSAEDYEKKDRLPKPVALFNVPILDFAVGGRHSLFLDGNGKVYSCGNHVCAGHPKDQTTDTRGAAVIEPRLVQSLKETYVRRVGAGAAHSFAVTDTEVYSFGENAGGSPREVKGQLGRDGDSEPQMVEVLSTPKIRVAEVSGGDYHSIALTEGGEIYSFGGCEDGRLGHGESIRERLFVPIRIDIDGSQTSPTTKVVQLSCGKEHNLILTIQVPQQLGQKEATEEAIEEKGGHERASSRRERADSSSAKPSLPFAELKLEELRIDPVPIASGAFGVVYRGLWHGVPCAIKRLNVPFADEKAYREFVREASLMEKLGRHPNVVSFFGALTTGSYMSLVTEFAELGSVYDFLVVKQKQLPFRTVVKIARDAALGILHLHCENVIHRDIAARNVLLKGPPYTALVTDFGLSRILTQTCGEVTQNGVGPVSHMAPEAILNKEYSQKSDAWSFGVFLWELIEKKRPYGDQNLIAVALDVGRHGTSLPIPKDCDPVFGGLMNKCFSKDPNLRPSFEEIYAVLERHYQRLRADTSALSTSSSSLIEEGESRGGSVIMASDVCEPVEEGHPFFVGSSSVSSSASVDASDEDRSFDTSDDDSHNEEVQDRGQGSTASPQDLSLNYTPLPNEDDLHKVQPTPSSTTSALKGNTLVPMSNSNYVPATEWYRMMRERGEDRHESDERDEDEMQLRSLGLETLRRLQGAEYISEEQWKAAVSRSPEES
ncbi:Tyrosine-protein kinase [Balamuthia mandrillaris]